MAKKPNAQSGRVAYDERGQPVWEWRVDTGVFTRDVDTRQMRKIQEEAAVNLSTGLRRSSRGASWALIRTARLRRRSLRLRSSLRSRSHPRLAARSMTCAR